MLEVANICSILLAKESAHASIREFYPSIAVRIDNRVNAIKRHLDWLVLDNYRPRRRLKSPYHFAPRDYKRTILTAIRVREIQSLVNGQFQPTV